MPWSAKVEDAAIIADRRVSNLEELPFPVNVSGADTELKSDPPVARSVSRRRAMMAIATGLVIAAGLGSWAVTHFVADGRPESSVAIADLFLSTQEDVFRGRDDSEFRARRLVYLHFDLDRAGWAFAALFGNDKLLQATSKVRDVVEGHTVFPFRLDNPGSWSFVLMVSATPRTTEEFKALIGQTFVGEGSSLNRQQRLDAVVGKLRWRRELSVEAVTFELLPP